MTPAAGAAVAGAIAGVPADPALLPSAADLRAAAALERAAPALRAMLGDFHAGTGCEAALWTQRPAAPPERRAATGGAASEPPTEWPRADDALLLDAPDAPRLVVPVPGVARTWLALGPDGGAAAERTARLRAHATFLAPSLGRLLHASMEAEQAARELGERYEEINLLYSISETLGRAVTLEENAATILDEVADTVGAAHAAIYLHDRSTDTLLAIAARGVDAVDLAPLAVDDGGSVVARAFRTLHPSIVDRDEPASPAEAPVRSGAMLTVPILWTTRHGGEPLGVMVLSGRRHGQAFTAGDLKLVTAIASQIAAAIQNARLVRASLQQQRMTQEMALAHDLQMKLLPSVDVAAPHARVAARVVPAESVGGDFYHLFQLGDGQTGVMIGDVSGHGYRAAMIMALAMSATAIHAQSSSDPGETLGAVLRSLREELSSTEMFISAFYAVVDPRRRELRYANAGHPHAFVVGPDGTPERLAAGGPPLGMVDEGPSSAVRTWRPGEDLLVLFTDGVSDARDHAGARLGERPVLDTVLAVRPLAPGAIVARVFDTLEAHAGDAPPRDDLTLVVLRS